MTNIILTAVPSDNVLIINGEIKFFEYEIQKDIHALHWNKTSGEIEFKDSKPNLEIGMDDYDSLIKPLYEQFINHVQEQ